VSREELKALVGVEMDIMDIYAKSTTKKEQALEA
jgi:hypothetical protein